MFIHIDLINSRPAKGEIVTHGCGHHCQSVACVTLLVQLDVHNYAVACVTQHKSIPISSHTMAQLGTTLFQSNQSQSLLPALPLSLSSLILHRCCHTECAIPPPHHTTPCPAVSHQHLVVINTMPSTVHHANNSNITQPPPPRPGPPPPNDCCHRQHWSALNWLHGPLA